MDISEIESEYIVELSEICEASELIILKLEKLYCEQDFNELMRNLHNLKGTCAALGLSILATLFHDLETYLLKQSEEESIDNTVTDYLLTCISTVHHFFEDGVQAPVLGLPAPPRPIDQTLIPKRSLEKKEKRSERSEKFYKNPVSLEGLIVYYIDDDKMLLEIVKNDLSKIGCQVETFENLAQLRKGVLKSLPDLFIIDNRLENETGTDIMKDLNKIVPSIPKIIYTGYMDEQLMVTALNLGAYGIIEKPMSLDLMKVYLQRIKRKQIRDEYITKSHLFHQDLLDIISTSKDNIDFEEITERLRNLETIHQEKAS